MAKATETIEQKVDRLEGAVGDLKTTVANQAAAIGRIQRAVNKLIKENEELQKGASKG